ncbi:MAG: LamG domain-containing protein [Spirochaetes bacterium]|nr:LamG domain-containing protein [Spirochaetota bacterium]
MPTIHAVRAAVSRRLAALSGIALVAMLPAAPVGSGLVGHWTFDAADVDAKGLVQDKSAAAAHGTATAVAFEGGKIGNAARFDGKESVIKGKAPVLAKAFTLMAWVKISDLAAGQHTIWSGDVKGSPYLRVNQDGNLGFLKAEVAQFGNGTVAVKAGEWTHVAATFDGEAWALYVDGKPAGSGKTTADFAAPAVYSIGRNLPGGPRPLKGLLDELRVYNRALSAAEVAQQAQEK